MQLRRRDRSISLVFPGKDVGKILVVAPRFSVGRLMLFAEMATTGFVAGEGIDAHELAEFQEVRHAAGAFQRLVERFSVAWHPDLAPEMRAHFRDPGKGLAQAPGVARHPAFVPEEKTELAM